jgi:hypothetical protein
MFLESLVVVRTALQSGFRCQQQRVESAPRDLRANAYQQKRDDPQNSMNDRNRKLLCRNGLIGAKEIHQDTQRANAHKETSKRRDAFAGCKTLCLCAERQHHCDRTRTDRERKCERVKRLGLPVCGDAILRRLSRAGTSRLPHPFWLVEKLPPHCCNDGAADKLQNLDRDSEELQDLRSHQRNNS